MPSLLLIEAVHFSVHIMTALVFGSHLLSPRIITITLEWKSHGGSSSGPEQRRSGRRLLAQTSPPCANQLPSIKRQDHSRMPMSNSPFQDHLKPQEDGRRKYYPKTKSISNAMFLESQKAHWESNLMPSLTSIFFHKYYTFILGIQSLFKTDRYPRHLLASLGEWLSLNLPGWGMTQPWVHLPTVEADIGLATQIGQVCVNTATWLQLQYQTAPCHCIVPPCALPT